MGSIILLIPTIVLEPNYSLPQKFIGTQEECGHLNLKCGTSSPACCIAKLTKLGDKLWSLCSTSETWVSGMSPWRHILLENLQENVRSERGWDEIWTKWKSLFCDYMSAPADTLPCIERGQRIKSSSDSKLQYLLHNFRITKIWIKIYVYFVLFQK